MVVMVAAVAVVAVVDKERDDDWNELIYLEMAAPMLAARAAQLLLQPSM